MLGIGLSVVVMAAFGGFLFHDKAPVIYRGFVSLDKGQTQLGILWCWVFSGLPG